MAIGAIVALVAFNAIAILVDWIFWDESFVSMEAGLNLTLMAVATASIARSQYMQVMAAAAYLLLAICGAIILSPISY